MIQNFKSVLCTNGEDRADELAERYVPQLLAQFPVKFWWFATRPEPYVPHVWQYMFHGAHANENLVRFRHLVAGRRGGKTLSAAWEVLFYSMFPEQFHRDAHGRDSQRPLWVWCLAKDYQAGRPSLRTFLEVLGYAGLVKDKDYRYNRAQQTFEFIESGTLVEFKTANDPQSLRGAGLDILWIDEAAFIPTNEAWDVVRSALGDKQGLVITTTTPWGKNWFYETFFTGKSMDDAKQFRVEYTSIDNPYYPREEWEYNKEHMHPVVFAQEHLASFDAMAGTSLSGDWLHYYVHGNPDTRGDDIGVPREGNHYSLKLYIGVDPAISLAETADDFAMALIGVDEKAGIVYLLDYYLGHISFPDQLDKIREWFLKWRPELIGIESNAYQAALAQTAVRMDGLPNIVSVFSTSRKQGDVSAKNARLLAMAPLFKVGKVRIHREQVEFIDQWVSFDAAKKNQKDDLLDAVEIALGCAGALMPMMPHVSQFEDTASLEDHARQHIQQMRQAKKLVDPDLGEMA